MNPNLLEISTHLFSISSWKTTFGRKPAESTRSPVASSFLAGSSYSFLMVNMFCKLGNFQTKILSQQKCSLAAENVVLRTIASVILVAKLLQAIPQKLICHKTVSMAITLKTYCINSILDTFAFEISPTQNVLFSILDLFKLCPFLQI